MSPMRLAARGLIVTVSLIMSLSIGRTLAR
jgi:hypothetical protein